MTRKCVADDVYGRLRRRLDELARRVDEGNLNQCRVMEIVQHTIEGKMSELFSAGGVVLSELHRVPIEIGPDIRSMLSTLDKSFPCHGAGKVECEVGVLRYVRFSPQDVTPGTKRVLRDMADRGVRAGTASELLAMAKAHPIRVSSWGEYVVALGSATKKGGILCCERGFRSVGVSMCGRSAAWWPSCYSFFVVKDS